MAEQLTLDQVSRVAFLARLELSAGEKTRLTTDLNEIIGQFERLQELDTDGVPPHLLAAMLERRALDVPLTGRPWKTAGYGLGVMIDIASPLGRCVGHSGEGHGSVCAAYHFPDGDPPLTVAAFAPHEDEGAIERLMLEAAATCSS